MRRLGLIALLLSASTLIGCRSKSSAPNERPPTKERLARIQDQEWRRAELRPGALRDALKDPLPEVRARVVLAIGRMGLVAPVELLGALKDKSSRVRSQAAFALALLVNARPSLRPRVAKGLITALSKEKERAVRQQLMLAIGRVGRAEDRGVLEATFSSEGREAALRAWGLLARRVGLGRQSGAALAPYLSSKRSTESRAAAWAAAQRGAKGEEDPLWNKLLAAGSEHDDEPTRRWAVRAVARQAPQKVELQWLLERLRDPAASVREAAAETFSRRGVRSAVKLTVALRRLWREAGSNHHRLTGTSVFPVLAGVRALERRARIATIRQFAADLLYLSDASDAAIRYSPTEASSVDRVHCAAARLWDLGVERIERTPTCGTARAPDLSASWRRLLVVNTIVDVERRDAEWKLTLLRRYLRDPAPGVREGAIARLSSLDHPTVEAALTRALDDRDPGVLGAAFGVIAKRERPTFAPALAKKVAQRVETLKPLAAPLLVCDGVAALQRLGARFALPLLDRLQRSPALAIQRCASRAVKRLQPKAARPAPSKAPSRGLPDLRWTGKDGVPLPRRAVLVTQRGEVQLELFAQRAPAAVAHFARHARNQRYKGSLFLSRQRGRVTAGTRRTPRWRGDGPTLPDECSPSPVAAGLLAMHRGHVDGRPAADSASRAFFITLEERPDLELDVTIFGRVRSGLEVLQKTHESEKIKDLYIPQSKATTEKRAQRP